MISELPELSRAVSHALRHEPWLYRLQPDEDGWVPVADLLVALRKQALVWADLDREDLVRMIATSAKRRHELDGEQIRALYGHSVPVRSKKSLDPPPELLFHGTSPAAWRYIANEGLRPMRRQFVHLSIDTKSALEVGRRKSSEPQLLEINAGAAHLAGVSFWKGNEAVWLTRHVPTRFISAITRRSLAEEVR
jgi:putative RNA 2'-phosphotransferase